MIELSIAYAVICEAYYNDMLKSLYNNSWRLIPPAALSIIVIL